MADVSSNNASLDNFKLRENLFLHQPRVIIEIYKT